VVLAPRCPPPPNPRLVAHRRAFAWRAAARAVGLTAKDAAGRRGDSFSSSLSLPGGQATTLNRTSPRPTVAAATSWGSPRPRPPTPRRSPATLSYARRLRSTETTPKVATDLDQVGDRDGAGAVDVQSVIPPRIAADLPEGATHPNEIRNRHRARTVDVAHHHVRDKGVGTKARLYGVRVAVVVVVQITRIPPLY